MAVFTIGSKTLSGSPTGGAVGGASNLTTVGAIPYVSASGVLNQDATNFFWDATNHRLGVGTASPVAGYAQTIVAPDNSATTALYLLSNNLTQNLRLGWNGIFGSAAIDITTNGGIAAARFNTTGNLLIGGTTDGNYKLDVQKSGSTGTLRVFDQTATTGSTLAVVRAGAGQSGNLTEWQDSAGTAMAFINASGTFVNGGQTGAILNQTQVVQLGSDRLLVWGSTGSYGSTKDLGLARNAAGVLEINNGTAGTYRDLKLRALTATGGSLAVNNGYGLIGTDNSMGIVATAGQWEIRGTTGATVATVNTSGTFSIYNTLAVTGSTLAVIQAGAGQSGNLLSVRNNAGTEIAAISSAGWFFAPNSRVDAGGSFYWNGRSNIDSPGDGVLRLTNAAVTDFYRLQFGGTTSSFPALKRSSAQIHVRLADDSAYTGVRAASYSFVSGSMLTDASDGIIQLTNAAGSNFDRLIFGIGTSAFPSWKRSSAILQARLADDSANTQIQASRFISDQTTPSASTDAGTAGAIWADANYIYVQTGSSTVKRIALTTF